jgi:hypothetical protein
LIELRSETDRLKPIQEKMQEYIENGLRLGWLINPQDTRVEIYRLRKAVEVIQMPAIFSGEDILPGCVVYFSSLPSPQRIIFGHLMKSSISQTKGNGYKFMDFSDTARVNISNLWVRR